MAQHRLYEYNDLQKMIIFLRCNEAAYEKYATEVDKMYKNRKDLCGDTAALYNIVHSGSAETFYRYDSAVGDKFINITEKLFGKNWHEKGIKF